MPATLVFFEAPHRLGRVARRSRRAAGRTARAAVARELAKLFEEVRRAPLDRTCRALCRASRGQGRDRHRDRPAGRGRRARRPSARRGAARGDGRRLASRMPPPRSRRALDSGAATSMLAPWSSSARAPQLMTHRDPPEGPPPRPHRRVARAVAPAARRLLDPGAALQDRARRDRHRRAARRHPGLRRGQGAGRSRDRAASRSTAASSAGCRGAASLFWRTIRAMPLIRCASMPCWWLACGRAICRTSGGRRSSTRAA